MIDFDQISKGQYKKLKFRSIPSFIIYNCLVL